MNSRPTLRPSFVDRQTDFGRLREYAAILCRYAMSACVATATLAMGAAADEPAAGVADTATEATARIEQELVRNTDVEYVDTPLIDVANDLEIRHKLNIELDSAALAADGKGSETPISKKLTNMPLSGVLNRLFDDRDLAWYVKGGVLMISTPKAARAIEETRVYSVAGLAAMGDLDYDAIETTIDAAVFRSAGTHVDRTIRSHGPTKTLIVTTNPIEQREVARLVGDLHEAVRYQGDRRVLPSPSDAEAKIDAVLRGPSEMQYLDTELRDVRTDLELRYRIHIEFDATGIADAGNPPNQGEQALVNLAIKDVPFGAALDLALAPLGLTWTRDDVSLIITSKLFEPSFRTRRIYRVGDMVKTATEYEELKHLIRETIAADSWRGELATAAPMPRMPYNGDPAQIRPSVPANPGYGEIAVFRPAEALVVTQAARTHWAIEKLLDDLRAAKGK